MPPPAMLSKVAGVLARNGGPQGPPFFFFQGCHTLFAALA